VEIPQPANPPATTKSLAARIGWLVLILVTLYISYFSHLGAIGFVGPDEPRYAWIARDMAETGDWVTPRLYGKPWFEKPPLYYWAAALSFKLFGVSEAAARLPSAVSALLATLALAWLAMRIYGEESARWLLLLLPTTVGMIGFSHAAATDMPFSAMLTIAMVAAASLLRLVPDRTSSSAPQSAANATRERSSFSLIPFTFSASFAAVVFGFFLGLAVLAKGPAAIILCGGTAFFWALVTKRWPDTLGLFHPAGIVALCGTALPWYVLCAHRNPDFFRIFIVEHNFKRFLTPEFQHTQPFWFYVPVLLVAMFPWSALFIGLTKFLRSSVVPRSLHSTHLFLLCWPTFTFLFFSLSKSKLPGYLLPAVPPLVVLFSGTLRYFTHFRKRGLRHRLTGIGLCLTSMALLGTAGAIAAKVLLSQYAFTPYISGNQRTNVIVILALCAGIASLAGVSVCLFWYRHREKAATVSVLALFLVVLILFFTNAAVLDEIASVRPAFRRANEKWRPLVLKDVRTYKLHRGFQYSLSFYLRGETRELSPTDDKNVVIFTERSNVVSLEQSGFPCSSNVVTTAVVVCRSSP
jgi:4-amino-4-deoxy-L-arabinose transferase-like glycosyltransferase